MIPKLQAVQHLLQHGASINEMDDDGRTPLMDAVMGGHILVSQLLRFNNANLGPKIMVRYLWLATFQVIPT